MNTPIVVWSASATHIDGAMWRVDITAEIAPGYHIYDTAEYDYGANSTVVEITSDNAHTVGDLQVNCQVDREYDDILGFELGTISNNAAFSWDVQLDKDSADLEVYLEWMACNENSCTPLDDTVITLHVGEEQSSGVSHALGFAAGVCVGLILVFLGHKFFKKNRK